MSIADFKVKYDAILHKIYHMIQAYWYGTEEVYSGAVIIDQSYDDWVEEYYFDICGLDIDEEVRETFKLYTQRIASM